MIPEWTPAAHAKPVTLAWPLYDIHPSSAACQDMRHFLHDSGEIPLANSYCGYYDAGTYPYRLHGRGRPERVASRSRTDRATVDQPP